MNKLVLGTVQFGSDYGIKKDGQPLEKEIEKISKLAWDSGIDTIFNSPSYKCDGIIEKYFSRFIEIRKTDEESRPQKFVKGNKQGVSLYELPELYRVSVRFYDMVCIPVNIFDLRFARWIYGFKPMEIYARSVFLQGLLLMDNPPILSKEVLGFHDICEQVGKKPYEIALGWVLALPVDYVIIGVNSVRQLKELLKVEPFHWNRDLSINDENIIDPRKWDKVEPVRNVV